MELRLIVELTQRQKAEIVGRGGEIPYSPMSFEIDHKQASLIAEMDGEIEVSQELISAVTGGYGNQLHVPYQLDLGGRIAKDIADGTIQPGANIDYIFEEVAEAIARNKAEAGQ